MMLLTCTTCGIHCVVDESYENPQQYAKSMIDLHALATGHLVSVATLASGEPRDEC